MKKVFFLLFALLFVAQSFNAQPQPPSNLSVTVEHWQGIPYLYLTWEGNSESNVKYIVYKKFQTDNYTSNFFKLPFSTREESFKDFFVAPGFVYSYYVVARDRYGSSAPSDTVTIEIPSVEKKSFLAGKVTDELNGEGLVKVRVWAIPTNKALPELTTTNEEGNFNLNLSDGEYYLKFCKRGYLPEFYNNKKFISDADKITLSDGDSIFVSAALTKFDSTQIFELSGTVTDSSGKPIGARIKAISLQGRIFNRISKPAFTDSLGNYSVKVIKGDSVVVFMRPFDRRNYKSQFYNGKNDFREADKIFVDGNVTGIDFVAEGKPTFNNSVTGKVTDENSEPLQAVVILIKLKDNHRRPRYRKVTLTDSLGNYNFENIRPGKYIELAMARGGYLPSFYRANGEQTFKWKEADTLTINETTALQGIDFALKTRADSGFALIKGFVKDDAGSPISGVMVYALDENNNVANFSSTEEDGSYSITDLRPGSYNLYFEKTGFTEGESRNITLDYSQNITGFVTINLSEESVTNIEEGKEISVEGYKLFDNYPNPFGKSSPAGNSKTEIKFQIPQASYVTLKIYNALGQEIKTLATGFRPKGIYTLTFDGRNLSSGIYFYSLRAGNSVLVKKMILLK